MALLHRLPSASSLPLREWPSERRFAPASPTYGGISMHFPPINYLAVLVAGIVIFVLGGLWYSPVLFVKPWIALQNKTEEQMRAEAASANMPLMYGSAFLTGLIIAWALALVLAHIGRDPMMTEAGGGVSVGHGAIIGFVCWLGFAATTSYATAI